jgi:hypothetical protein
VSCPYQLIVRHTESQVPSCQPREWPWRMKSAWGPKEQCLGCEVVGLRCKLASATEALYPWLLCTDSICCSLLPLRHKSRIGEEVFIHTRSSRVSELEIRKGKGQNSEFTYLFIYLFYSFVFFLISFIHMCIQCLGHFSPPFRMYFECKRQSTKYLFWC